MIVLCLFRFRFCGFSRHSAVRWGDFSHMIKNLFIDGSVEDWAQIGGDKIKHGHGEEDIINMATSPVFANANIRLISRFTYYNPYSVLSTLSAQMIYLLKIQRIRDRKNNGTRTNNSCNYGSKNFSNKLPWQKERKRIFMCSEVNIITFVQQIVHFFYYFRFPGSFCFGLFLNC